MRRAAVVGSSVVATMAVAVAVVVIEQPGRQRVVKSGASQASTVAPPPTATVSTAAPTVTAASPAAWSGPPIACGTLSLPWNAPAGRQVSTSATLGGVSATFSGTSVARAYSDPTISGAHLTITAGGAAPHSEQVFGSNDRHGGPATNPEVVPWSLSASPPDPAKVDSQDASPGWTALCLARFAGDSQPTVLLGLDLGGAHCCALVRAYTVSPNSTALSYVEEGFGNSAGRLQTDGDHAILVTADDTFNYAFTSYAASATPVKVLDFQHGAFVNVTRQHLDLVRPRSPVSGHSSSNAPTIRSGSSRPGWRTGASWARAPRPGRKWISCSSRAGCMLQAAFPGCRTEPPMSRSSTRSSHRAATAEVGRLGPVLRRVGHGRADRPLTNWGGAVVPGCLAHRSWRIGVGASQ